jgi:alpha-L-fucosidase
MLKKTVLFLMVLAIGFYNCSNTPEKIEYSWESIATVPIPAWFEDAKLGIFIHWGVYAVPGYSDGSFYAEWYPHYMYRKDERSARPYHVEKYGSEFGYADFVDRFKAEKWDPEEWAELFQKAGARYIAPVAEHHDGFAMWDSDITTWDAMERGPKRDIIGELGESVRKRGMKYVPAYHRERHFNYFDSTAVAPEIAKYPDRAEMYGPFSLTKEFIDDYVARWKELETKYQPDFMWLDHTPYYHWKDKHYVHMIPEYKIAFRDLVADYLNAGQEWGKEVYFNNKGREHIGINFPLNVGIRGADNLIMTESARKWQNPATIANSYGYAAIEEEKQTYKTANELIDLLVDIVSKNGNLLLNVGPRGDGTISETQTDRLLKIGEWLEVNGEAIYGSRPWRDFGEGPNKIQESDDGKLTFTDKDFRFTKKDNYIFAFIMEWPQDNKVSIAALAGEGIKNVALLGHGPVDYKVTDTGLEVQLPQTKPCIGAYTLKIKTL